MTTTLPPEVDEDWRSWPAPKKLRFRWRLATDWNPDYPRPNQLTPGVHHLCQQPRAACEEALRAADARNFEDPLERLEFLQEHGHVDWLVWLMLTGRGWGKTRVGAEDMAEYGRTHSGTHLALVGATLDDVRKTMVEGESGLLAVLAPEELRGGRVDSGWNRTTCELWLANGTKYQGYSAEKPNRLRGPQHHRAWCDELAAWENMQDTWDNLMFGLRLGDLPQAIITTTPRPKKLLIDLRDRPTTVVVRGSMYENRRNLAPPTLAELKKKYEGTRVGRQELHGELIEEIEGALWARHLLEADRMAVDADQQYEVVHDLLPFLRRVVVAVDPAVTSTPESDETGIIVGGVTRAQDNCPVCRKEGEEHVLILADRSCRQSPRGWGTRVITAYDSFEADRVVAERNNGGDLVEDNLVTLRSTISVVTVHAKRGKSLRAQPVASLYEQHKVHHIGVFAELEDQQCTWDPEESDDSPDRLDALVYLVTELLIGLHTVGTVSQQTTALEGRR